MDFTNSKIAIKMIAHNAIKASETIGSHSGDKTHSHDQSI
jgi:hypothetical protein